MMETATEETVENRGPRVASWTFRGCLFIFLRQVCMFAEWKRGCIKKKQGAKDGMMRHLLG